MLVKVSIPSIISLISRLKNYLNFLQYFKYIGPRMHVLRKKREKSENYLINLLIREVSACLTEHKFSDKQILFFYLLFSFFSFCLISFENIYDKINYIFFCKLDLLKPIYTILQYSFASIATKFDIEKTNFKIDINNSSWSLYNQILPPSACTA